MAGGDGEEQQTKFQVWKEHWPALQLFLAAEDCWVFAGMGAQPVAFDYTRAEQIWRLSGADVTPKVFAQIKKIAAGGLDEMGLLLAERNEKKAK